MQNKPPELVTTFLESLPFGLSIFLLAFAAIYALALLLLPLFVWAIRVHAIKIRGSSAESRDELRRIRQALERAYPPPRSGP